MDEELIDYLFETSRKEGFKKNREDFVKYLQSDDELFDYLYDKAQKEGYKKDKTHFAGLVGRTTTAAPVATTEPTKTEPTTTAATTTPAKTEPAKTEPTVTVATESAPAKTEPAKELSNKPLGTVKAESIPQREVEMPVADETKMPPMMVREAAPIDEEEPKKEMPIGENLLPVTEKTEVKAVETPSDKMVIKSEKKEEPVKVMTEKEKKEWQCPPAEGGCPKNKDVVHNYFNEKYKNKDYTPIIDREGNLAKFIDDGGRGVPITEYYGRKSYTHDSYGFTYSAEELPKSERFSVYNVPIEGKETSVIYDNKTGVILKDTKDAITTEDGKQMKTWLDVPTNNPEYQTLKAEIDKSKGGTTTPKVSTVPTLEPWQQPQGAMQVKEVTEQPKVEVKAEEPKIEVKEVTKEEPKMVIKSDKKAEEAPKFKDKSDYVNLDFKKEYDFEYMKSLDSNHVERKNLKDKQVLRLGTVRKFKDGESLQNLSIGYDKSKNKWFSYDFEESGKGYDKWEEVKSDKLISFLNNEFKDVTENKQIEAKDFRKLESDYMPDVENKAKIAEFYFKITPEKSIKPFGDKGPTVYFDEKENEYFTKDKEGRNVIEKGSEKYNQIQNKIVDLASKQPVENNLDCPPGSSDCSNKDDFDESYKFFKSKDPFNTFGYYTQKEGNLATHLDKKVKNYNNQEWEQYRDDVHLHFLNLDLKSNYKEDDPKIKQYKNKVFYIGETPPTSKRFSIYYLDDSNKSYIYDNETKSIMKELDSRVNLTTGRKKAWESILVESPEYKEARDAIEFIKYKKIKGNRNTSIPTFNPVPETPDWQK
tara:strand:+ start:419 stop:2863 length:2445 start_codon:yes stop_codon:yes gene_type:complete